MNKSSDSVTPLMKQFFAIKEQYPESLLFFQVGDFYELFFDDAKKAAAFLGITLTSRGKNCGQPIPLCGVPVHALDHYLSKLVRGGFRVAICDQQEEAKPGTVVRRGVTQVLTPGTLTDTKLLDDKSASYLLSFFPTHDSLGLLFGELLTGQLFATTLACDALRLLEGELARFIPDEILLPESHESREFSTFFKKQGFSTSHNALDLANQEPEVAWLSKNFRSDALTMLNQAHSLKSAVYNFYWYLKKNQAEALAYFKHIHFYEPDDFLLLDPATQANLELVKNCQNGNRSNTLFSLLDEAVTPMGSRSVKKWLVRPLLKPEPIAQRHDIVEHFVAKPVLLQNIQKSLREVGDLERIVGRIALMRATAHDYCLLSRALEVFPTLKSHLIDAAFLPLFKLFLSMADFFSPLQSLLQAALDDDIGSAKIIKKGFDKNLDELRNLVENSNQALLALEKKEQEKTSINSLKVRYNQIQGYYIEVTKPNVHLVPSEYIKTQSLVGKERFTTLTLKQLESDILSAKQQVDRVEQEVFERIKREVADYHSLLRKVAQILAHIDALAGFAVVAHNQSYVRPTFNQENLIEIKSGCHPVVAAKIENRFIPNDILLDNDQRLLIITGPNMGGKSTYLRQTALICIMAQCGSFVPAKQASVPLLDRVFTRIGAGDNVAEGKSTFLVEMEETAVICTQATQNSLVILDEVGRGTSTFDGLAIAQAVVEYIYTRIKARCLFATHYHELTHLSNQHHGIVSYYAASKKTEQGILLLYKILKGEADGSFGLEVAKLAQLPEEVIKRAHEILYELTNSTNSLHHFHPAQKDGDAQHHHRENQKLQEKINDLCAKLKAHNDLVSRFHSINLNELSPKQAFDILWQFKEG